MQKEHVVSSQLTNGNVEVVWSHGLSVLFDFSLEVVSASSPLSVKHLAVSKCSAEVTLKGIGVRA